MKYKRLAISLAIPQLAGLAGSFFTAPAIQNWYVNLQRPSFSPPNWLFGPVWITLYLMMGVSIYLIWNKLDEQNARGVFWLFWIHLFFNATWSMIFFGLHNPMLAFINIAIIWIFIIVLIFKFWKINKWASYLLVPYFFWVSFASVLNYFIWYLN